MRLRAAFLAAFLVSLPFAVPARAQEPDQSTYTVPLADPALEARAKALQRELRCLVCQGESIDESNAPLAADLRRLIREQIKAGQTDDQIKDFLVARYGAFVLMKPPVREDTVLLWFGPALLIVIGGAAIAVTIARSRRRLGSEPIEDAAGNET
jgi:cytochrome c-type biogenesis protein CcmH